MVAPLVTALAGPVLGVISDLVDRTLPDSSEREKVKLEYQAKIMEAITSIDVAQIEVNKEEARHASLFVAGWRPFIGWTCGAAFCYHTVVLPLLLFAAAVTGEPVQAPAFDMEALYPVLLGMLGLGTMRSYEKAKGVTLGLPGRKLPWSKE